MNNNRNGDRAEQLQFLRFLAFLLVFLYHASLWIKEYEWLPNEYGAACAVAFFFILSGFGTAYASFNKSVSFSVKAIYEYVVNKLRKNYPLYFVTTIFTISYSQLAIGVLKPSFLDAKEGMIQLFKNLLLIQSWFPEKYFSYNGVGWFLSTIMFLYFLNIPLLSCATKIKRLQNNKLIFSIIFAVTFMAVVAYCYVLRDTNKEYTQYVLPIARVGEYIMGICLGYIVQLTKKNLYIQNKIIFTGAEVLALLMWIYSMYMPMEEWQLRIVHWIIPNCILLIVFAYGRGYISEIFSIRLLKHLGDISFGCYLVHSIILRIYKMNIANIEGNVEGILGSLFSTIFCLMITIMISELICPKKEFRSQEKMC